VPDPNTPSASQGTLDQLQLHIGDRLQLEMIAEGARNQYFTLLIGYVPGHSVMVRTPLVQNLPVPIREGEPVLVRSFSGRHASSFESTVTRACRAPFPYLHLAYPQTVSQTLIRGAMRVRVNLAGTAHNPEYADSDLPNPITIADLSVSGALLESATALGETGSKVELAFKFLVQPNNYEVRLTTPAEIQSVRKARQASDDTFVHGVRFQHLHTTESLLLQSFIQQVVLADRSKVV
jgi:c-di-GMP-binding flagellar brake protein YcgR